MRRGTILAATCAAAVAVAGCSREAGDGPVANASVDTAAAADAIRAEEAQWNRDYAARNAEAILTHYAADGTLAGPGGPPISGSEAIGNTVRGMVADPAFRLEFASDRIEVASSGDMAYTRGHFALTTTNPVTRAPGTMRGTYLTVWRKQADGRWQALEDMVTPGPPSR